MYSVYALTDPRNEAIRYIGMSKNVWRRYAMHLLIPSKTTSVKNAWIEELRGLDLSPLLTILETVDTEEKASERETYWIQYYLDLNTPLTNIVKTGKAVPGRRRVADLSLAVQAFKDGFLTIEEIASTSGVSEDTISRYIKEKRLVAYKISGSWRIKHSDLEKFVAEKNA